MNLGSLDVPRRINHALKASASAGNIVETLKLTATLGAQAANYAAPIPAGARASRSI